MSSAARFRSVMSRAKPVKIVRDPLVHAAACDRVAAAVRQFGFVAAIVESPILGAEGNKEFLLYAHH